MSSTVTVVYYLKVKVDIVEVKLKTVTDKYKVKKQVEILSVLDSLITEICCRYEKLSEDIQIEDLDFYKKRIKRQLRLTDKHNIRISSSEVLKKLGN